MKLRLAVFGTLVVAAFVALFSRLWFLQVLAAEDFQKFAKENRIRTVYSEPPRGRILDNKGTILVDNRRSVAITVDRQVVDTPRETRRVVTRLSRVLDVKRLRLRKNLTNEVVSPYKPVVVATEVKERDATYIQENPEDFPGVDVSLLPFRKIEVPNLAPHILGYTGEISPDDLESEHFKGASPPYGPGDIVGRSGVEYTYDRFIRGKPEIKRVVVNSAGEVVGGWRLRPEQPGDDLVLSMDSRIQAITQSALASGINAARAAGYRAPAGGVAVLRPNGRVAALASYPTYNPKILANGFSRKDSRKLGLLTPKDHNDDALFDRAIQSQTPPGSTYKVVTAGAAMAHGVATPYTSLDCNPSVTYEGTQFNNWTTADMGYMGLARSLEVSCDTFYYQLGWKLEHLGPNGTHSEKFQHYQRLTGFGHDTGIDLPNELPGRVPDEQWCREAFEQTRDDAIPICAKGWLPGYTVNMAIGQGDLLVTPLQMAVAYAAIANGGKVYEPRVAKEIRRTNDAGRAEIVREIKPKLRARLPLDATELGVMRQGLIDVVSGGGGTARDAFAGFPLSAYPVAGKTGTAQIGSVESGLNYAWFMSYAPANNPKYVIAVYLEKAGHGGESAAPVARQIFEGIFGIDNSAADVRLGSDVSG